MSRAKKTNLTQENFEFVIKSAGKCTRLIINRKILISEYKLFVTEVLDLGA